MKKYVASLILCVTLIITQILPINAINVYQTETYDIDYSSYEASLVPTLNFSVTDWEYGDVDSFLVYQKGVVTSQAGIGGMGIVAKIEEGPLKIYAARTTEHIPLSSGDLAHLHSSIVRVTDPDGNLAAVVDFSDMDDGSRASVITIPNAKAGIWTIQMMNGRNGDIFEIGLSSCIAWGVRGEKILGTTETTPKTGYIYAPRTADFICLESSDKERPISVYKESGELAGVTADRTKDWINSELILEEVEADSVYKLEFAADFDGSIAIDGVTGAICPTAEMAEELKGGWVDASGTMCQGPLQARAREELIRLATTKDLSVVVDKPDELPETIENPMAEAQMFGATGVISRVADLAKHQITDVNNPYIGLTRYGDEVTDPNPYEGVTDEAGFESCNFLTSMYASIFAQAASIPLKLNYAKGQEGYVTRAAMVMLYNLMMLSEDSYLRVYNLKDNVYPLTGGMFVFNDYQIAYSMIADYLDNETREILFQGLLLINDKQGDYRGQGVTNQGMFHMSSNIHIYSFTGIERYHNTFKRQLRANLDRTHEDYGLSSAGYFIELAGCDGSYEYMNRCEFYHMYNIYSKLKNADKELLADFKAAVEKTLNFEAYFCAPQPESTTVEGNVIAPNCFVTRNPGSSFGGGGNPSYEQLFHEFPMAARRMQVYDGRSKNKNSSLYGKFGATAAPHHINNEEWALAHIQSAYKSYENAYKNTYSDIYPFYTYDAYEANTFAEPAKLPCEAENGTIFEENGFIAIKHQGIYLYSFYGTEMFKGWYARNYAYMGGGPTGVWTENTGVTLSSQKHLSRYDMPTSPDEIVSSCMYGYDANGNFLFSGKEGDFSGNAERATKCNKLIWLEEGKSFRIEGVLHNSVKKASWKYTLDEDGILVTAKMSPILENEEFWLNLPIAVKDENLSVSMEDNRLTTVYGGDENSFMTYSWDSDKEAVLLEKDSSSKTMRLRIKLDEKGEATFRISSKLPDVQLIDSGFYQISDNGFSKVDKIEKNKLNAAIVNLRNNTDSVCDVVAVFAVYDDKNKLTDLLFTERKLQPGVKESVGAGLTLADGEAKVKVMVFEKMATMKPLINSFLKTVE